MKFLFLLDVAPGPESIAAGVVGLILLAFVVLMITGALIFGFVFLLKRLNRSKSGVRRPEFPDGQPAWGGTVREGMAKPASAGQFQPSNPNQP